MILEENACFYRASMILEENACLHYTVHCSYHMYLIVVKSGEILLNQTLNPFIYCKRKF